MQKSNESVEVESAASLRESDPKLATPLTESDPKPADGSKPAFKAPSQEKIQSPKASKTAPGIVVWDADGFLDWNPGYLIRMRGIMNILHLCLSLAIIVMLGMSCQLRNHPDAPSEGFFCKNPEVYFFVVSCSAFITSVLYLCCCLLSKRTDSLLFQTSLEISYFILYFVLYLTSSVAMLISILKWGPNRDFLKNSYQLLQTTAIVGLVNCAAYGLSALWFFISSRFYHVIISINKELVPANE